MNRRGFALSFLGVGAGAIFSLLIPLLPGAIPWMDIGVGLVVVIWLSFLRRYSQIGWLESFVVALPAALIYIVVLAIVSAFMLLFEGIFLEEVSARAILFFHI